MKRGATPAPPEKTESRRRPDARWWEGFFGLRDSAGRKRRLTRMQADHLARALGVVISDLEEFNDGWMTPEGRVFSGECEECDG